MKLSRVAIATVIAGTTVVGARAAHAQAPGDQPPAPQSPQAPQAPLAQQLAQLPQQLTQLQLPGAPLFGRALTGNNLRVAVNCAYYFATPDQGLNVSVDGAPAEFASVNGANYTSFDRHGNAYESWAPTDVGFDVAPGHHHVTLTAPGCAADDRDLDVPQFGPTFMSGRLAIDDPSLLGTVGSPNGFGYTAGFFTTSLGQTSGTTTFVDSTTAYTRAPVTLQGATIGTTFERRHLALAVNSTFAYGTTTGTMHQVSAPAYEQTTGTTGFTDSLADWRTELRVGARLPYRDVELAAGAGLGLDLMENSATPTDLQTSGFDTTPTGFDASVYVPVWATVTYKPTCALGLTASASYDVHPTESDDNALSFVVGMVVQPSAACSEAPGISVR